MKLKRLGALALALALVLSLTAVPAWAEETEQEENTPVFSDLVQANGNLHWATSYIEDMAKKGYAKGEGELFYPERTMSALETILFCARITNVDKATQEHVYADHRDEVASLLPESVLRWASAEATIGEVAVAMEAGVASRTELEALNQIAPGSLNSSSGPQASFLWNISRENVFLYLVRAMQLEPLANSFSPEICSAYLRSYYADADEISPVLQPYIYVLTYYKILEGSPNADGKNLIRPRDSIKRCEMMKIVSLALNVMETLDIHTELSEYTEYDWAAGEVVSLESQPSGTFSLVLDSPISGEATYELPAKVNIYKNNMRISENVKSLAVGDYVRLNFDAEGKTVESVRVSGALKVYTGKVSALDAETGKLVLAQEGATRAFQLNRFTEVLAGSETGDRTVIDPLAGYTDGVCYVNERDQLVGLKLTGGTVQVTGLLQGMAVNTDGSTALTLNGFDGVPTVYTVPATATILVNEVSGILAPAYVGRHVTLRVAEGTRAVARVSVDTLTTYIQGRVVRQGSTGSGKSIVMTNALDFNREQSYQVDAGAFISYAGEERTASQIEDGWFVTVRLVGGVIVELTGYPSSGTVEGVLSAIQYSNPTVITLALSDGGTMAYELDIHSLPSITRNGKKATVDQLRTGDTLTLTLRYNEVQKIDAMPQEANLTGTIQSINLTTGGNSIDVILADGTTANYPIGVSVSVTKGGAVSTLRDLNAGDAVALVTSGGEVLSIAVTAAAVSNNKITGMVYTVTNTTGTKAMTILIEGRTDPVTVDLRTSGASIVSSTGTALSLSSLKTGDQVDVYGSYNGSTFVATLVIRQ